MFFSKKVFQPSSFFFFFNKRSPSAYTYKKLETHLSQPPTTEAPFHKVLDTNAQMKINDSYIGVHPTQRLPSKKKKKKKVKKQKKKRM